jgi:serine protease Do
VVQILVNGYGLQADTDRRNTGVVIGRQRAIGSGFVIDSEGYIMTNAHVVNGAETIRVLLPPSGPDVPSSTAAITTALSTRMNILPARIVGVDRTMDVALLKVEGVKLPALPLASYRDLRQGEMVFAFGSPEGLRNTVTHGVVSAVARQSDPDSPQISIQTDAAINPGNSGGPLVDSEGHVVGINTAISSRSGGSEGVGFAIPVGLAKSVLDQLRANGHVERGWLGVGIQEVTPELARSFDLRDASGALVASIAPGGPAEHAGLQRGDVIVEFDGHAIADSHQLPAMVAVASVGSQARLTVLRGGAKKTIDVTIASLPEDPEHRLSAADGDAGDDSSNAKWGLAVTDITPQLAKGHRLPRDHGVVVTGVEPSGPAAEAGIQPGDIVREVNRAPVESSKEFRNAVQSSKHENLLLLMQRGEMTSFQLLKKS